MVHGKRAVHIVYLLVNNERISFNSNKHICIDTNISEIQTTLYVMRFG